MLCIIAGRILSMFVDKKKVAEESVHPRPIVTLHHDVATTINELEPLSLSSTIADESISTLQTEATTEEDDLHGSTTSIVSSESTSTLDPIAASSAVDEAAAIDESIIDIAKSSLLNGKIEASVDALLQVIGVIPDHIEANKLLGFILLTMQKYEDAERFLYTAVDASKWTDSDAVANLAQVLIRTNASEWAIKALARGMEAVKGVDISGTLSQSFGDAYLSVGNYTQAADWYLHAALKKPLIVQRWIRASTLRFPQLGQDIKFAENVLLQGYSSNPASPDIVFYLGVTMHKKGQLNEAVLFYTEAIRMMSSDALLVGVIDKEKSSSSAAVVSDPPESIVVAHRDAHAALATALHALALDSDRDTALYQSALDTYIKAEQLNPTNEVLLANFALFLKEIGRGDESTKLSLRAHAINPNHPDVMRAVSECSGDMIVASNG